MRLKLRGPERLDRAGRDRRKHRLAFVHVRIAVLAHHVVTHQLVHQPLRLMRREHVDLLLGHENVVAAAQQRAAELRHERDRRLFSHSGERRIRIIPERGHVDVDARSGAQRSALPSVADEYSAATAGVCSYQLGIIGVLPADRGARPRRQRSPAHLRQSGIIRGSSELILHREVNVPMPVVNDDAERHARIRIRCQTVHGSIQTEVSAALRAVATSTRSIRSTASSGSTGCRGRKER
jgi:hypothetical protein